MGGWWGKLQGNVLRIALVLQYLGQGEGDEQADPYEISEAVMRSAIQFADGYLAPMAERAHGLTRHTAVHQNAITLAEYIREQGLSELTIRDIHRTSPLRPLKADDVKQAVNELVMLNWLRASPVRNGSKAGKSQALYVVNPSVWGV